MDWWYLSFAKNGWLGACIVEADGKMEAVVEAHRRGINPGGQVFCGNLTVIGSADDVPPDFRNRLLNKEDLIMLDKAVGGDGEVGTVSF